MPQLTIDTDPNFKRLFFDYSLLLILFVMFFKTYILLNPYNCVENVHIRSYSGPYAGPNAGKYGPE